MSTLRNALRGLPRAAAADLLEREDAYLLVIDLPGATAETTEISVADGRLHIEAQREKAVPEGYRYAREERSLFLDLELPLPPDAATEDATATLEAGVLELELPRTAGDDGTTIPIEDD
ncbi:MAG: Hsp20/alpha crystallin family protein [Halobacteriales archaeon]|nr:Hsp20/alpha crystallin family protein [Halobacteriales archaeon]